MRGLDKQSAGRDELAEDLVARLDEVPTPAIARYLVGRADVGSAGETRRAADLAPDVRSLCETVAERLNLAVGVSRFEAELVDGRLQVVWLHSRFGATQLEQF